MIATIKDDTKSDHYSPTKAKATSVKLPKLSIPKFDGDVLNWRTFWKQFQVSVQNRDQLSNAERLAYLKDALKDGQSECINQGLAQTADTYDVALQHYQALKYVNEDSFEMLLMPILELKIDPTMMRDWQRSSWEHNEVPPCSDLLDFIDLQACDSENSLRAIVKKCPPATHPDKTTTKSYMTSVEDNCVVCKRDNDPLYVPKTFIVLSPEKRNGSHPRQSSLFLVFEVRTFCKAMPIPPEM